MGIQVGGEAPLTVFMTMTTEPHSIFDET